MSAPAEARWRYLCRVPLGCRVLLVEEENARRFGVREALFQSGYAIVQPRGELDPRIAAAARPCVIVLNLVAPRNGGAHLLDMARHGARRSGVPLVAVCTLGGPLPGVDISVRRSAEPVGLLAAVEVACFGHDHWEHQPSHG